MAGSLLCFPDAKSSASLFVYDTVLVDSSDKNGGAVRVVRQRVLQGPIIIFDGGEHGRGVVLALHRHEPMGLPILADEVDRKVALGASPTQNAGRTHLD